jgi:curli biogenesis system outer membrane secretion channel CsgG
MKRIPAISLLLLLCAFALAAEERPRIGVAEFTNDTSAAWWYGGAGRDLSSMLTNELASTDKFKIVERSKTAYVLDEQDLGNSGRVSKKTAAKMGKMTGAQYLVVGTVSAFEQNVSGGGGGLSLKGFSLGGKKEEAYIAIDLRVIDTTTGEIEHTRTIEARSTSYGIAGSGHVGGLSGGLGKYEKTPAGKAIRACLVEITEYLECVMVDQDSCAQEYKAKDKSRREKTKKSIKLD